MCLRAYLSSVFDVLNNSSLRGASSQSALHCSLKAALWCALVNKVVHSVPQTLFLGTTYMCWTLAIFFFFFYEGIYFAKDSPQTVVNPMGFLYVLQRTLQSLFQCPPAYNAPRWFLQTVLRPCAILHWLLQSEFYHLWHSTVHVSYSTNHVHIKMFSAHLNNTTTKYFLPCLSCQIQ